MSSLRTTLVVLCLLQSGAALADPARELALKESYLFNFMKFVEWPAEAHEATSEILDLCVYGNDLPATAFESLNGKTISAGDSGEAKRAARVRHVAGPDDVAGCQVLFVSGTAAPAISTTLLVVGDQANFIQSGGMIGLVKRKNRFAFEINLAAARDRGLRISSNLLRLATQVIE